MTRESGRLARVTDTVALVLACAGTLALMAVVALTVTNAVLRSFFSSPILGTDEVAKLLSLIAVVSFLPVSFLDEHHLEIDMVVRALGVRIYRMVGVGAAFLVAAFLAAMTWQVGLFAANAKRSGDATWFLALKTWPWWVAVCVILAIAFVVQVIVLLRQIDAAAAAERDRS
jgi:TRAP-type C4-dicarboxylate transport system permease small subunit